MDHYSVSADIRPSTSAAPLRPFLKTLIALQLQHSRVWPSQEELLPNISQPYILIVDDSPLIVEMLAMICTRAGWETRSCGTLKEVTSVIEDRAPSVVLIDLNLPDTIERETVGRLKRIPDLCDVPTIVISGRPLTEVQAVATREGVAGALSKEAGFGGLATALPALLENLLGQSSRS